MVRLRVERELEFYEGFPSHDDPQGHRDLANRLTSLFLGLEHGTVALLDGRWGVGKTTFARRFVGHLKARKVPAIYFDAFASDYQESPFVAVAGAIAKEVTSAGRTNDPKYRTFLKSAAKVGRNIAGVTAKLGVKAATLGLVGHSEIEAVREMADDVSDALSDSVETSITKLLETQKEREEEFEALKKSLDDLPRLLRPSPDEENSDKLIVVIDELDRCRPDFALGVLEVLKHFFGHQKIHFILVTNRQHLALSVNHRYGSGPASDDYLRKFYDFVIHFDQTYRKRDGNHIGIIVRSIGDKLLGAFPREKSDIINYIEAIALAKRLSIREVESIMLNVALAYVAVRERELRPVVLITFLALLKAMRDDLYRKARAGTLTHGEFNQYLTEDSVWGDFNIERVMELFELHLSPEIDYDEDKWSKYRNMFSQYMLDRDEVIPYMANSVLDRFGSS